MPQFIAARGTAIIRTEFSTSPIFTDTNTHFANMWNYLSNFLISYNHSFNSATREWTVHWEFVDVDKLINDILALQDIYGVEWLERIVSLEVHDGSRWKKVNVTNNRLQI